MSCSFMNALVARVFDDNQFATVARACLLRAYDQGQQTIGDVITTAGGGGGEVTASMSQLHARGEHNLL